jgi:hypothetical protein
MRRHLINNCSDPPERRMLRQVQLVFLFIYDLFSDAYSSSHYTASNDRMISS